MEQRDRHQSDQRFSALPGVCPAYERHRVRAHPQSDVDHELDFAARTRGVFGEQDRPARINRALALELAPDGITVNGISPGPFATEMNLRAMQNPELNQQFTSTIPVGRWGKVEEIGQLALYLCSEDAGFITGTDILIDGGWSAVGARAARRGGRRAIAGGAIEAWGRRGEHGDAGCGETRRRGDGRAAESWADAGTRRRGDAARAERG